MKNLTFKQLGILVLIVLLVSNGLVVWLAFHSKNDMMGSIKRLGNINETSHHAAKSLSDLRGYQITGKNDFLDKFRKNMDEGLKNLDDYISTAHKPKNVEYATDIKKRFSVWKEEQLGRRLELVKKERTDAGLSAAEHDELQRIFAKSAKET